MINTSGERLRNQGAMLLCFCALICMGSVTYSTALAGESLPTVVAVLSEDKARIEGRAGLAQGCLSLKADRRPILGTLEIKFSDARSPFNAWIDGQIALLKTHPAEAVEKMTDLFKLQELNTARNKGDEFVKVAERELQRNKCAVAHKVGWGAEILKVVGIEAGMEFLRWLLSGGEDKHKAVIDILESYKIVEWRNVRSIVVYDWTRDNFYDVGEWESPEIWKKGGTVVYLNKWALTREPPTAVLLDKELPPGLSMAYQAYGGPAGDLGKYMQWKQ